jgi:hypothetical protein
VEDTGLDSLEAAYREGEISEDQYEALKARLVRKRAQKATRLAARRLLWTGLILVAILVIWVALTLLDQTERIAVLGAGLGTTLAFTLLLWRQPDRLTLSRGLLGLTIFQFTVLLLLLQGFESVPHAALLPALIVVTVLGAVLGIRENSTWLATPSVLSFYIGFIGLGIAFVSFNALVETSVYVSVVIAAVVAVLLGAWRLGQLQRVHTWYLRSEAALGQLGRGHFVLFTHFMFFALTVVEPFGGGYLFGPSRLVPILVPFGIALAGLLYAWKTENGKLLTVASLLILALAWFLLPFSGVLALWPIAVSVTAAVLIYLGLRSRLRSSSSKHERRTT